jgi:hypothetical protein
VAVAGGGWWCAIKSHTIKSKATRNQTGGVEQKKKSKYQVLSIKRTRREKGGIQIQGSRRKNKSRGEEIERQRIIGKTKTKGRIRASQSR